MGLGLAYINSMTLLQTLYPMPFYYNKDSSSLQVHPYLLHHTPWKMPLLFIGVLLGTPIAISSYAHLHTVYTQFEPKMAEEFMVYCYLCSIIPIYYVTMYYLSTDVEEKTALGTRFFRMANIKNVGWPWPATNRIPCFQEVFGYGLVLCCILLFPLTAAALTFYKPYHPATVFFRRFVPDLYEFGIWDTAGIGVYSAILILFGIIPGATMLLNMMMCVHELETLTHQNFENCLEQKKKRAVDPVALLWKAGRDLCQRNINWRKTLNKWRKSLGNPKAKVGMASVVNFAMTRARTRAKFRASKLLHQQTYILAHISNHCVSVYITIFTLSGLAVSVVSNFGVFRFIGTLEFMIYGFLCFSAVMCTVLLCFLCWKASSPSRYSTKLSQYWKGKLYWSAEQKELDTLRPIRMTMGPFFQVRKGTALDLLSTVQDYTLTFLMGW